MAEYSCDDAIPAGCRVRNLSRIVSGWLDRLAASRSVTARRLFCADIAAWRTSLLEELEKHSMSTASLSLEQQRQLARTLVWCDEPWLSIIPQAAEAFETELKKTLNVTSLFSLTQNVQVFYLPLDGSLWRFARNSAGVTIAISDLFLLDESGDVPRRLARFLSGRRRRSAQDRQTLKQWLGTERVLEYARTLERHTTYSSRNSRGKTYDLAALYAAINQEYFSGSLCPPELCWSRRQAHCRTGYYDSMKNCITLSRALDAPEVPEYVIRFVLYHEMLHQEARLALMGRTRRAHDAAFRKAERKFTHYAEAEAYLKALARKKRV